MATTVTDTVSPTIPNAANTKLLAAPPVPLILSSTEEIPNLTHLPSFSLSLAHVALLQPIISSYHFRLLQHWIDSTDPPERPPDNHITPPSIKNWPRKLVWKVLDNYQDFLIRKSGEEGDLREEGSALDEEHALIILAEVLLEQPQSYGVDLALRAAVGSWVERRERETRGKKGVGEVVIEA